MKEILMHVLEASFYGSIAIAAVLVLRLLLRRAPKKFTCWLWILVGIRLLLPISIESRFSLQPDLPQIAPVQTEVRNQAADYMEIPGAQVVTDMIDPVPAAPEQSMAQNNTPVEEPAEEVPVTYSDNAVTQQRHVTIDYVELAAWLWLTVACGFGVYSLISYIRLKRLVREAVKIQGGWECDKIDTAFILGYIDPKIYIPMGVSEVDRMFILEHEQAHMEKGDHWVKLIGFITLSIHWFNPLVWLAYILLCRDIEVACDERVVEFMDLEERKYYSAALLQCSANRIHFAACPVAFGEVSVKHRIISVLRYKRPGFWISLAAVAAVIFVAVCLIPSPEQGPKTARPDATDGIPSATGESLSAVEQIGIVTDQDAMLLKCTKAMEELIGREHWFITTHNIWNDGFTVYEKHDRKDGENYLQEVYTEGELSWGGYVVYDGIYSRYLGDYYVIQGENSRVTTDYLRQYYSPDGKTITFPEGTGNVDGAIVLHAEWEEVLEWGTYRHEATMTYTFQEDGTLATVQVAAKRTMGEDSSSYVFELTVQSEAQADTAAKIKAAADSALTSEEVESKRREKRTVTERPSNKTAYDKDYALGSAQMGWQFMEDRWFIKFGSENISGTGVDLVFETIGPYAASGLNGTMTTGDTFYIEVLEDGVWKEYPLKAEAPVIGEERFYNGSGNGAGVTLRYDWTDSYGALPDGFYRIGLYFTFTSTSGETDTQLCYAKFRLYNENYDALLEKCRSALEDLLASESYHIRYCDWRNHGADYYRIEHVWKNGADYLQENRYLSKTNPDELLSYHGTLLRGGIPYTLEWAGESATAPIAAWETNTFTDESNFTLWTNNVMWYDSGVAEVTEDGRTVRIVMNYDFDDQYEARELAYTFDADGALTGIVRTYLPTRNCAEKDKVMSAELTVCDTEPKEIARMIESQDVSKPGTFSYEEDAAEYTAERYSIRSRNFANTAPRKIGSTLEAIRIAEQDCTLPDIYELGAGYNIMSAFYDADAKMWKIVFSYSQDDNVWQAVYMTHDGITKLTVANSVG